MHAEYDDVTQARIKKIMQGDDDVGKVAAAVPVIICILAASSVCVCLCVFLPVSLPLLYIFCTILMLYCQ